MRRSTIGTAPPQRTLALAWYSMLLDIGLALGSLLAGLPFLLRAHWKVK